MDLMKVSDHEKCPLKVGRKVAIQSITHYFIGVILDYDDYGILLGDAIWIADTGAFGSFLWEGQVDDFENFPDVVYIVRQNIVDLIPWTTETPNKRKKTVK
jgi:hypothetical protein